MFYGFCLPSLRCLISALTQEGSGDLLFRFTGSVKSCYVEGRALQTDTLCVGSTCRIPATLGLPHSRGVCAFPIYTAQAPSCSIWSGPCVECGSSFWVLHQSADLVAPAFCAFPCLCGSGSQRLARTLPGCSACHAPFPSAAPARSRSGLRKSLDRNRGLFAVLEGVVSLGLFAPFPSPLPPSSSGDGPALLWSFSVPLFCETQAVCSGRLIFSLAVPQFIKAPSDCSQGLRAGPYPKQCRPLLSVPPRSTPTWRVRASGVLFCWELLLGT